MSGFRHDLPAVVQQACNILVHVCSIPSTSAIDTGTCVATGHTITVFALCSPTRPEPSDGLLPFGATLAALHIEYKLIDITLLHGMIRNHKEGNAMAPTAIQATLKVADEVWIATALLHRDHPEALDFAVEEIVRRAEREGLHKPLRRGVYVHVIQHCVANRPPNPGRYRMLFRKGDSYHPGREGAKLTPEREDLPYGHNGLLSWYHDWSSAATNNPSKEDPLLSLRGSGKHLWADEHADDYVRRLREGWE